MASSQTFHDHIKEFRRRLMWVILAVGVSASIAYVVRVKIIYFLQQPLGIPLYYSSPAGSFNFIVKLSMMIGCFVALPVMIYQLIRFIEPALPMRIKKAMMVKIIATSFALALAGLSFGFFIMLPMSLHFFAGYSSDEIKPLIGADEYLKYVINNLLVFALAFQLPLIALFINWIKPLKPRKLLHYQRHVIAGAFVIALLLPFTYDPVSQFIVALPIVGLFYISVILIAIVNRRHNKRAVTAGVVNNQPLIQVATPTIVPVGDLRPQPFKPATLYSRSTDGITMQPMRAMSVTAPVINESSASETKPSRRASKPFYGRPVAIDGISHLLNPAS